MTHMSNSLISVIIPVYNGEKYLAQAIESILAQAYRPLEIIVVDDGSTDGSAEIVQRFGEPIRYVYQTNQGAAAARNRGVEEAQGEYYAFLDQDDLWLSDKLTRQMAAFAAQPDLDLVAGAVEQFWSPDVPEEARQGYRCMDEPVAGLYISAFVIKRDAFWRVGLFDTNFVLSEAIEWNARAQKSLNMLIQPDLVMRRRLHTTNMTMQKRDQKVELAHYLKQMLDRRRAATISNND